MTLNCCFETLQATTGTKSEELVKLLPAKGSKKAYKNISNMARQGRRGSAGSLGQRGGGGLVMETTTAGGQGRTSS